MRTILKVKCILSKEGAPAKGFVTDSWRIKCTRREHVIKEMRLLLSKADCSHEMKTPIL